MGRAATGLHRPTEAKTIDRAPASETPGILEFQESREYCRSEIAKGRDKLGDIHTTVHKEDNFIHRKLYSTL